MIISEEWVFATKKKPVKFLTEDMTLTNHLHRAIRFETKDEILNHLNAQLEKMDEEDHDYDRLGVYHMVLPKKVVCQLED